MDLTITIDSVKTLEDLGFSYVPFNPGWDIVIDNLSKVPVVSLALGPVAGLGAARLVSSHYSIMVKRISQVFVAGPPLVKEIGEIVTKEELGGSDIHGKNGVICLFLKGERYKSEIDKTLNHWFFDYDVIDSLSCASGKIIKVENIIKR